MKKLKIAVTFDFATGLHFGGLFPTTTYVKVPDLSIKGNRAWPWFSCDNWTSPAKRTLLDPETLKPSPLHLRPTNHTLLEEIERAFSERLNLLTARCVKELGLALTDEGEWAPTPASPQFFYPPKLVLRTGQWIFFGLPKSARMSHGLMPLTSDGVTLQALAPRVLDQLQREAHKAFDAEIAEIKSSPGWKPFSYDIQCYSSAASDEGDNGEASRVLRKLRERLEDQTWVSRVEIRRDAEPYDWAVWAGNAPENVAAKIRSWGFDIKELDLRVYRGQRTVVLQLNGTPSPDKVYITLTY